MKSLACPIHHRCSIFNALLVVLGETDDLLMAFSRAILPLAKSLASKTEKKSNIYTYILCDNKNTHPTILIRFSFSNSIDRIVIITVATDTKCLGNFRLFFLIVKYSTWPTVQQSENKRTLYFKRGEKTTVTRDTIERRCRNFSKLCV